jgi:hypothetical protein
MESIPVGPKLPTVLGDNPFKPGHGTCVAAKVIGKTVGLARNANIVVTSLKTDEAFHESWLDGILKIYERILSKGTNQGGVSSAIINISIQGNLLTTSRPGDWNSALIDKFGMFANTGSINLLTPPQL